MNPLAGKLMMDVAIAPEGPLRRERVALSAATEKRLVEAVRRVAQQLHVPARRRLRGGALDTRPKHR